MGKIHENPVKFFRWMREGPEILHGFLPLLGQMLQPWNPQLRPSATEVVRRCASVFVTKTVVILVVTGLGIILPSYIGKLYEIIVWSLF